jgi:hypothetical protein
VSELYSLFTRREMEVVQGVGSTHQDCLSKLLSAINCQYLVFDKRASAVFYKDLEYGD